MVSKDELLVSEIISARWDEAIKNPDIARWRSLAYFVGDIADKMIEADPHSIQGYAMRGISVEAHKRYMEMMP